MKRARTQDLTLGDGPASKIQHLAPKTYLNTNISGNAAVVQGDVINHYGDQHYHLPPSRGPGLADNSSDREKFDALLASLAFENMGARQRNVGPALSTTCQWLRTHERFVNWLEGDQGSASHGFLWIKGKPGSGKSTIMRETLLWMSKESPKTTIASYFFDARSPYYLAKSTQGMYQALLHQLLSSRAELRETFLQEFSSKINGSNIEGWSETEIQNFMISLANTKALPALTVFIDALDEDDGDDIQQMITFFEDLQQQTILLESPLRICLSGRHYPHISIEGEPIVLEEQPGHEKDINEYVRTRLLGKESYEQSEIRGKIVAKAAGVFLWVVLMVQILNKEFNRGKGLTSMRKAIDRAPEKVHDLFSDILARDEGNKEECINLLRWVLFSERPLLPIELYAAVRYSGAGDIEHISGHDDEEVSRYILHCSRGLVETTKPASNLRNLLPTIQFIHETVREMLLDTNFLTNHRFALPGAIAMSPIGYAEVCQSMIAESCLAYLCDISAKVKPMEWSGYILVDYAAKYWWSHLDKTSGSHRARPLKLASRYMIDGANQTHWSKLSHKLLKVRYLGGCRIRFSWMIEQFCRCTDQKLCRAVIANIPELIKEYVGAGEDINFSRGVTALEFVTATDNTRMAELLLELGADPNATQQLSALGTAVQKRATKMVRILLEAGAAVDATDSSRCTPLVKAAISGFEDIVSILLDWGADINSNASCGTPLFYAAREGHENVVKTLIERGADVRLGTVSHSPLGIAALKGFPETVRLLLDYGAPIEYGGKDSESPLQLAKRVIRRFRHIRSTPSGEMSRIPDAPGYLRHEETARILLACGGRPVFVDPDKDMDKMCLSLYNGATTTASFLFHQGSEIRNVA